ncbi:DUF2292 domain-containing protein [Treponema primitia]|uniref:DUF2292 domain-containing protein n=1 Tax=Treponema primitia TaxID=88058 RepID=UPI00025554CA|nr:DUF2292 domain-containing protein [Treponema primitia]
MEKRDYQKSKQPNYQPVLFDKLRNVRNGSISIIKQDSVIVQINVFERIQPDTVVSVLTKKLV